MGATTRSNTNNTNCMVEISIFKFRLRKDAGIKIVEMYCGSQVNILSGVQALSVSSSCVMHPYRGLGRLGKALGDCLCRAQLGYRYIQVVRTCGFVVWERMLRAWLEFGGVVYIIGIFAIHRCPPADRYSTSEPTNNPINRGSYYYDCTAGTQQVAPAVWIHSSTIYSRCHRLSTTQ